MPSVYDYRHIELDRVGSGKRRSLLQRAHVHHEDTKNRIFGSSPPPTPSRRLSNDSLVSMSPGRLIKAQHQRSNIFGSSETDGSTRPSSSASSVADLSDIHPVVMTPTRRIIKQQHITSKIFPAPDEANSPPSSSSASSVSDPAEITPVVMSPGRIIKKQHMSSSIFAVDTKRNQTSPASSTDAVSEMNDSLLI